MKVCLVKSPAHDVVLISVSGRNAWVKLDEIKDFVNDETQDYKEIEVK